jgi:DNA polymerase
MGIADDILADWHAAQAALAWQVDLGVEDWGLDAPLNRYDLPEALRPVAVQPASTPSPASSPAPAPPPPETPAVDTVAVATQMAERASTLDDLRTALAGYPHCDLRRGARNMVFADGLPGARVMIVGEASGAEEDREGRPFVGRAGQLLDAMFAAIGLSRTHAEPEQALYITNVLPWRPPGNRDPEPQEIAMMQPFVARHIALAAPQVIVVMGNIALRALTGTTGILKARGVWTSMQGIPVLPMTHPAYLLRNPVAKREAWADLLALEARLST